MPKLSEGQIALGGLAAIFVWAFVILPFLYGPPPRFAETSRPPQPHSEQPTQNAGTEPKGTKSAPLFVQIIPTPKTAEERAQETEERQEKTSTDWWLTSFTGAVAFFTLALVGATGALWYAGERQIRVMGRAARQQYEAMTESNGAARFAAEAADLSARALIAAERPHIFIKAIWPSIRDGAKAPLRDGQIANVVMLKCALQNYGRTPAIVQDLAAQLRLSRDKPAGTLSTIPELPIILARDADHQFDIPWGDGTVVFNDDTIRALEGGQKHIWLHFSFVYMDVFGRRHETPGCWKYNFTLDKWSGEYEGAT
jgi:hypothetical protein